MRYEVVDELQPGEVDLLSRLLDEELGGRWQVRLGELIDVLTLPVVAARSDERLGGVCCYAPDVPRWELALLEVFPADRGSGLGGVLIDEVAARATAAGAAGLWLTTTNDNIPAISLYTRHGFTVTERRLGVIASYRTLKPTIPLLGVAGVPITDELILHRNLP